VETATFIIAVAGFLLSLISWIKDFIAQRVRLDVRISAANANSRHPGIFCFLAVTNRSRLPITITNIVLDQKAGQTACAAVPKHVLERTRQEGDVIVDRQSERSTALPVQLQSLGGAMILVLFESLPEAVPADATSLNLVICTNRGRPRKMTLSLPAGWADPRNIL